MSFITLWWHSIEIKRIIEKNDISQKEKISLMDRSDIPVSRIGRREIFRKKPIKKPEKGFPAKWKNSKRTNKKSELPHIHKRCGCHPGIPADTVTDRTRNLENRMDRVIPVFLFQVFPAVIDHLFDRITYLPFVDNHIHDCILSLKWWSTRGTNALRESALRYAQNIRTMWPGHDRERNIRMDINFGKTYE